MKVQNPLFRTDMPDPDVLRVGSDFYMVSTTMFYMPAAPVLKSKDLVHWEIVSYICSCIADNDIYCLRNGRHAYAKGQWATSLMRHKGRFYACFVCHDMKKTYLFSTDDMEKSDWDRVEIGEVFHDMSFLCWEDRVYLVYGNGEIRLVECKEDFSGVVEGSDRLLLQTPTEGMRLRCEGCRAYVKDGWIYLLFIDWPDGTGIRREVCYRARSLEGPFEKKILLEDDMWIPGRGIAQGPLFDDEAGNWYAMMFQDSGAVGRVPFLMPVRWQDGWPVLGNDGKVPETFETGLPERAARPLQLSDSFCHTQNRLEKVWQWNHLPDENAWSFTKRPGFLRLENRHQARELLSARNTLTQRTAAPYSAFWVCLECGGMRDGDYAGLCALEEKYAQIGVRQRNGVRSVVLLCREGERAPYEVVRTGQMQALEEWYRKEEQTVLLRNDRVWLKIVFVFDSWASGKETAAFYYSTDGVVWNGLGEERSLFYSMSLFVGSRIGIFSYNDERTDGGYADFCDFVFSADAGDA